ncbi:phosphopentomutase [Pseudaestuariivita sp.]|uniref:phosphopentomutase n=1 Tax=Pseudaestuariivita sp. TaxID=2211669 RepID=UPI004058F59D
MARAFLVVMDSVGIGGAPDAADFFNGDVPDTGSNTLAHIAEAETLRLPNLDAMGLGAAVKLASGVTPTGLGAEPTGLWGAATETSKGKDTPSGHWELAGLPVPFDWHYFPKEEPAFPREVMEAVKTAAGTDGLLGLCHASGTNIIERLGAEHLRTGWPICYTSVDSVFQIAAHEESFGLARLHQLCADIAPMLHEMRVGRVIARPFTGAEGSFKRTQNRKDFAVTPPGPVLMNWVQDAGRKMRAIGKIGDIFSMQGIDEGVTGTDAALMKHLVDAVDEMPEGSLTFANFVEFDSLYGHRRDPAGYARHLMWFDMCLGRLLPRLKPDDLLLLTADHGNDPTWPGTDHTRERVPVLAPFPAKAIGNVAFVDIAASVADHLGVAHPGPGTSFL